MEVAKMLSEAVAGRGVEKDLKAKLLPFKASVALLTTILTHRFKTMILDLE